MERGRRAIWRGMTRAGVSVQVEEEVKVPDCDAELAVVRWVTVPVIVAVVPDALLEKVKVADPAPPATASNSVSLNSIRISVISYPPNDQHWSGIRRGMTRAGRSSGRR
jgi:hypothetical protein